MKHIIFILIVMFSLPLLAGAQNAQGIQNLELNPQSSGLVQDVLRIVDKVKGSVPLIEAPGTPSGNTLPAAPATDLSGLTNVWNNVNTWCEQNIGISLREIINTVINFMIWIWELVIKLIRAGLSYL